MRKTLVLAASLVAGVTTAAAAEIIPISDIARGQSVTVAGTVEHFFDIDEVRLRDESGAVRVYLGSGDLGIETGDRITVSGVMDDDLFSNELYAREVVQANGEVFTISDGDE